MLNNPTLPAPPLPLPLSLPLTAAAATFAVSLGAESAGSKADAGRYIAIDYEMVSSPGDLERATENYVRTLHDAIDKAAPKIRPTNRQKARGWWNEELDKISKTVKILQEAARGDPINQDLANSARTARNARRNAVRAAKQSYLMLKLLETDPQDVWNVLRK